MREYWVRSLTLKDAIFEKLQEPDGYSGERVIFKNVEYPGEAVFTQRIEDKHCRELEEGMHFRIVFLTERDSVNPSALKDKRIAICIPAEMPEALREDVRGYAAISKMKRDTTKDPALMQMMS